MNYNIKLSATLICFLLSLQAHSADNKEYSVYSFSETPCGVWEQTKEQPRKREIYIYWIRGFVSGFNYAHPFKALEPNKMPDNASLSLFVDKHCRDNPLGDFIAAAFELIRLQSITVRK